MITVIVLVWDTGQETNRDQQYHKRAMMSGLFKEDEFSGIRYKNNMVVWDTRQQRLERAKLGGMFKEDEAHGLRRMQRSYIEVSDTGQQAHMVQGAKVDQDMVDQSAFFGWCTNVHA